MLLAPHPVARLCLSALLASGLCAHAAAQGAACEEWSAAQVAETRATVVGGVLKAYACRDPEGRHLFLASGIPQLKSVPDAGSTEVHFYKYTQSGDTWTKKWEARDFLLGAGSGIDVANFEVQAADGGASSVAYMAYRLRTAGVPTEEAKLLVFYKDRKFAVRGAIARSADDFASRNIDAGFSALAGPDPGARPGTVGHPHAALHSRPLTLAPRRQRDAAPLI